MKFIHQRKKYFIFNLKSNRLATFGNRNKPNLTNISQLALQAFRSERVWLKDVELPILLIKQVFINKDNFTGTRYLATNNLNLTGDDFLNIYKKRWSVEESHIFAAVISYTKLERYKFSTKLNHFALKSKLFLNAAKAVFRELELIKQQHAIFEKSNMTA